jgi:hypothetical protein
VTSWIGLLNGARITAMRNLSAIKTLELFTLNENLSHMIVRRTSILTGDTWEWDLPVTQEELDRFENRELVQKVWPHLPAEQRVFLLNGITPEEWKTHGLDDEPNV